MKKRYLMALALLPIFSMSFASNTNHKVNEVNAISNEETIQEHLTHLSIYNENGQYYHGLHIFDVTFKNDYSYQDFGEYVLGSYCTYNPNKNADNTSDGDMWWKYNIDQDHNDFLVCLGFTGDLKLPLWVTGFKIQAVKSRYNWTETLNVGLDEIGKNLQYHIYSNGYVEFQILDEGKDYFGDVPTINANIHCFTQVPYGESFLYTQKINRLEKTTINLKNLKNDGFYYTSGSLYIDSSWRHEYTNTLKFYKENIDIFVNINKYENLGYIYAIYPRGWKDVRYYAYSNVEINNEYKWNLETLPKAEYAKNLNLHFDYNGETFIRLPLTNAMSNIIVFDSTDSDNSRYELKNITPERFYYNHNYDGSEYVGTINEYKACDLLFKINQAVLNVKEDGAIKNHSICGLNAKDISIFIEEYDKLGDAKGIFDRATQYTYDHENEGMEKEYNYASIMAQLKRMNEQNSSPLLTNDQILTNDSALIILTCSILFLALSLSTIIIIKKRKEE